MIQKTPFVRTFFEASLPAWMALALLMFIGRGNMGLLGLAAMLFPGIWGALRLQMPEGPWFRRMGYYLAYCLAQGTGLIAVVLVASLILRSLGLQSGESSGGLEILLFILLLPGIAFLVLRGLKALPSVIGRWGWRGIIIRTAALGVLIAVFMGGYWWVSQPYVGHASFSKPRIVAASVLTDLNNADGWQVADPSVRLQAENGAMRLNYTVNPTWFYTVTWQIKPGDLPRADGFRLWARSDAATSFVVELEEVGGGKYRAWADLPAGDWTTLLVSDFLPFLEARDENDNLDWEQVEHVTFYVLLDAPGSGLWLDKIEAVTLDHSGEMPWLVTTSDHFWIRYHPSEQSVVADVQRSAEDQFERLTAVLGYYPKGRIPITIVSDHTELEQRQGSVKPVWAYANAFPDSLDILTPRLYSPLFNGHSYADIFGLLPHEIVHLLLAQIVGYPGWREMPAWLNEGLATYLAGQDGDEKALRDAAKQGKLPSLRELEGPFRNHAQPGISYAMAKSVTTHLVETYGGEKIRPLVEALARGMDFDSALKQIVGIDRATFEQQWREKLVVESK